MMIKRFFSFILLIISTVILFTALTLLIIRQHFVDADFYLKTFQEENVYTNLDSVIQNSLDSYFEQNIKVNEENQFGPKLSSKIAFSILNNIDKQTFIKSFVDENTQYFVNYLQGEDQIKFYFPKTQIVEQFTGSNGKKIIAEEFIKISEFQNLPDCPAGYVYQSLDLANGKINCKTSELTASVLDEISLRIPDDYESNLVEGFLNSIAPKLDEEMTLSDLTEDQNTIQQFNYFSNTFKNSLYLFLGMLLLGIAIALLSSLLSPRPALNFLKTLIYAGILMIMFSLVGKFVAQMFLNFYVWSRIPLPPDIYSEEQRSEIVDMLRGISESLLTNSLTWVIIVGATLIVVSIILIILFRVAKIIVPEEKDEENEEEKEDAEPEPKNKEEFEKELLDYAPKIT